jgi:hypothetical protein
MFGIDDTALVMNAEVKDSTTCIDDANKIARALQDLLHEDALHRLGLYQEYCRDTDNSKWTPDLYLRCQLAESLCKKLENLKR